MVATSADRAREQQTIRTLARTRLTACTSCALQCRVGCVVTRHIDDGCGSARFIVVVVAIIVVLSLRRRRTHSGSAEVVVVIVIVVALIAAADFIVTACVVHVDVDRGACVVVAH
jgi:hypothetical protein